MGGWLAKYWWLLWSLFVVAALVVFRMRKRGGDESAPRRAWFGLSPDTDPANPRRRDVTPTQIVLVGAGLLAVALALAIVKLVGP
ncbi:hypothetical protein [Dokdonella sp.]|uniref:hypothetical protein n=1 Tax=Dokdonella sp. TaxID=2291710 RepID=UPI003782EF70